MAFHMWRKHLKSGWPCENSSVIVITWGPRQCHDFEDGGKCTSEASDKILGPRYITQSAVHKAITRFKFNQIKPLVILLGFLPGNSGINNYAICYISVALRHNPSCRLLVFDIENRNATTPF